MQQLILSTKKNLLISNQNRIEDVAFLKLNGGARIIVGVRQGQTLAGYEYQASTDDWKLRWRETVFNQAGDYPLIRYPWLITDKLVANKAISIIQHPDGIRFYQPDLTKSKLQLLAEDGNFHEIYGWGSILVGNFYPNLNEVGVMSRSVHGEIQFYAATKASFLDENSENPLFLLDKKLSLTPSWSAASTDIFLTNLLHQATSVIGLHTAGGLEFYQFDGDYALKQIAKTFKIKKSIQSNLKVDRLFFADLTHQPYQDILHLNSNGLHVYQYNSTRRDYVLLHMHTGFSQSQGWLPHHSDSIKIADINRDSRDDLVFTGLQGLSAFTFDTVNADWRVLLDPAHLSGKQRYATVVGTLPPMPPAIVEPSVFTQDSDGNLQWAKVVTAPIPASTPMPRLTTSLPVQTTWTRDEKVVGTLPPVPRQMVDTNVKWTKMVIPSQETYSKILAEKPVLRWAEQWEGDFFKDVVETASGQVRFVLPLIDIITTTAWNLQLELFYHSQAPTSELLGEGWSIPLAQDYIQVDHQGSIYPEDAHYELVLRGQRKRLKLIAKEVEKHLFELAESAEESPITVAYYPAKQRWIIEGKDEQVVYGEARNALRWSLGWPHWRGSGNDKEHLQPLVTGWYVNARKAKHSQRVLYYDYEQDEAKIGGKGYTADLRLKTVRDDQELRLDLKYAVKTTDEYNTPNPIDGEGNVAFPVPLAHSHYLTGYSLTTHGYTLTLQFVYHVDHGKRLLTSIQQPILSHQHEVVLRFSYQRLSEKVLLKSCTSPTGSSVNFSYASIRPAEPDIVLSYPIREKTKISYGPDYAIMAYRDLDPRAGKVIFRILNRDMNKIISDCSADATLSCPSIQFKIEDYTLQTYQNAFVVLIKSDQVRELHFFERRAQGWMYEPTTQSFNKSALISFGETLIAVADATKSSLKLFERNAHQSGWADTVTFALRSPMTRLALHNRLVVGYDDSQLWLFYRDSSSQWSKKALASDLGGFKHVFGRFDLQQEIQQSLLKGFNQNGLQIWNNFIILNSIREENGQLSSQIYLLLMDDKYSVKESQTFVIKQENIYDLNYDLKHDGSTFRLGYYKQGYSYKLKIIAISGKAAEDIEVIGNKYRREDAKRERINYLNKSDGWKDLFAKNILIDMERYSMRMSQQGAFCGKDVLLKMMGSRWHRKPAPTAQSIPLGSHFILELTDNTKLLKLYAQDGNGNKKGQALSEISLYSPDLLVNRYPAYIAYQATVDSTRLLTFKDEKTVGKLYTFNNEQLLLESDWQNLMTVANTTTTTMVHSEPHECRLRPLRTIVGSDKPKLLVSQLEVTDGEVRRLTGYQHKFERDHLTYTETAIVIPGSDKNTSGWYEATRVHQVSGGNVTTTEKWFDASCKQVLAPPDKQSETTLDNQANQTSAAHPSQLFDRERKWLISDFSPYHLADESVAYYGFESYEMNQIGTAKRTWVLKGTQVIEKGFSFTGENYLEINSNASIEGVLNPRDQTLTYLASCWLRCSTPLEVDAPTSHFKGTLRTSQGQKIIGLQAQVKRRSRGWSYLEIPIDFSLVKQIYQDYYSYAVANSSSLVIDLPTPTDVRFSITLQVAAEQQAVVDLDHIRFSPLSHNFQATVYHPITGKTTDIVQANGLVTRTIYNRLQREIAGLQEDGELESFSSNSRTGRLVPSPVDSLANQMPATLTFDPEQGFYETFDPYSFQNNWKIDNRDAWSIAPGQLWHQQSAKHRIEANPSLFDRKSAAFRCYVALQTPQATFSLNWPGLGSFQLTRQSGGFATLAVSNGRSITPLPSAGEFIVMLDKNYAWLWLDGVLLLDQALTGNESVAAWSSFYVEAQGQVLIENCLVMNRSKLRIEYHNAFGEKTQVIQLVDTNTIHVTETLYDEQGREAVTSKTTRVTRVTGKPLLTYRPDFTTNKNPANSQSVWQTGKLQGEVDRLNPNDQGVAYVRTGYAANPLNAKNASGLAGPEFSVSGRYATKFSHDSGIAFLDNLYPAHRGFRQTVEHKPNGSQTVSVLDIQGIQVASYVRVPSYNHLLTTFEYDAKNRLIKILPPLYHEKVGTASKTISWHSGEPALSDKEREWQKALATFYAYDDNNHLVRKITPDTGTTEFIYDAAGQMRFMFTAVSDNQTTTITFFNYDINGQLVKTGFIQKPPSQETVRQYLDDYDFSEAEDYQQVDYADDDPEPETRGRVKRIITDNEDNPVIDEVQFNAQQQIVSKSTISAIGPTGADKFTQFTKQYLGSKLQVLTYPVKVDGKPLSLVYRRNRLGQLVGLGTSKEPFRYARFSYQANGHVDSEEYQPDTPFQFTRKYRYNSPGFLEQITDPFLTEEIAYTEQGYGQPGNGDGMVMQTAFNASWSATADGRWFRLKEEDLGGDFAKQCIAALQRTGYLTPNKQAVKLFLRDAEAALPLVCDDQSIAQVVAEKQQPRYYGHRYAYGNHQELVKAKYFTDETVSTVDPLQPNSFANEISGITTKQSQSIWQLLTKAGYVIADQQQYDLTTAVGKPGESFLRDTELLADLNALNDRYPVYLGSIKQLVMLAISERKGVSLADFVETFLHWTSVLPTSWNYSQQKEVARKIGSMLIGKGYLPTEPSAILKAIDKKMTSVLGLYSHYIPDILCVLSLHFSRRLGSTAFDVESYKIDANGNHHHFYTGFNRLEFTYRNGTNQIQSIKSGWASFFGPAKVFSMKHDGQGNVVKAIHAGIETIEYHPTSQRTTRIKLVDGRNLYFHYDAQGERVLKRVHNASGQLSHEVYYLRDEKGRVLVDQRIHYSPSQPDQKTVTITAYLYGPRGLLGFIRNDRFYSVMTDHAGSIRLVIRDGQVVAAYDYLPYGGIMRTFGSDPQSEIMYRYTGQEWDEETGLYNYHARLYDPRIGRFLQPDPQSQYFSPYKYAGNSPVSLIDPDGEFAVMLTLVIVGAIAGVYLGGAAANNRWNPADWDYKDSSTYLGIFGGALAGGLLPVGFAGSVGTIGVWGTIGSGVAGSYLTAAAANNNWDLSKWQWDKPHTYNALFQGISSGTGLVGGVGLAHNFAGKLSFINKTLFLTVSYSFAGGATYAHGVMANENNFAFWEWDFTSPVTWSALADGFDTGLGWPQNFLEMHRGIVKLVKNPRKFGSLLGREASIRQKLMAILKNPKHPFYKVSTSVVMAFFMTSSANNNFDITRWDLASFSTYESVINGIFFGKDTSNMLKFARGANTIESFDRILVEIFQNKIKKWHQDFTDLLDNVLNFRKKKAYDKLMANSFSTDTWRSKLVDKPDFFKINVEEFLKKGVEQWRQDKVKPPEEFQKLLLEETQKNVQASSSKLIEWQQESEQMSINKRTIFPDEDALFLRCLGGARRKKRQASSSGCVIPQSKSELAKPELVRLLFDNPAAGLSSDKLQRITPKNKSSPQGFAEHLSLVLEKTPKNLAPSKPEFSRAFVLGSFMASDNLPKFVIPDFTGSRSDMFTIFFKKQIGGSNKIESITFKFSDKTGNADINKPLNIVDSNKISKSLGLKTGDYEFEHTVYQINHDNTLDAQTLPKESFSYKNAGKETDLNIITNPDRNIAKEIQNSLIDISKTDVKAVENGAKVLLTKLLKIYDEKIKLPGRISEAEFHGFVYGALSSSYKYKYNLDVYVERIAGRGYADLIFLSRGVGSSSKNWLAVPIIIELKGDKSTTAAGAITQIKDTGYLYNLSMRTVSEKAVVIGVNSRTDKQPISTEILDLPKSKGLINELMVNSQAGSFETNLLEELKHTYYSISPMSSKTSKNKNNSYFPNVVLGELLSAKDTQVYVNGKANEKNAVSFLINKDLNWVMFSFIDLKGVKSDSSGKPIILPDRFWRRDKNLAVVNFEFNSGEKHFGSENKIKTISNSDIANLKTESFSEYLKIKPIDAEVVLGSQKTAAETELKKLSILRRILINSEGDFHGILQGLILAHAKAVRNDNKIVRVFPEANMSQSGRADLVIHQLDMKNGVVSETDVTVIELKISESSKGVEKKITEGEDQVLKYDSNLKSITDLEKYRPVVIVYNKIDGTSTISYLEGNRGNHKHIIDHSSGVDDSLFKKLKIRDRAKRFVDTCFTYPKNDSASETFYSGETLSKETSIDVKPLSSGAVQNTPWTNKLMSRIVSLLGGVNLEFPTIFASKGSLGIQRLAFSGSESESTPQGLRMVEEYTACHLQGGLQLADLLIRKVTGENYQCSSFTALDPLDASEARLQASLQQWEGCEYPMQSFTKTNESMESMLTRVDRN